MSSEAAIIFSDDPFRLRVPAEALLHRGFRDWVLSDEFPEKVKASWIEGEVLIDMSPEAIDTHNTLKTELTITLGAIVRDEGLGELYSDGVLFTNEEAAVSTEPDLMFVSFAALDQGRVHFAMKATRDDDRLELQGTPDLVVEVISDSSTRKDDKLLRAAYARAGVPEYWLLDGRGAELRFDLLRLEGGSYVKRDESIAFGRRFVLERKKNRANHWSYFLRATEPAPRPA
ncbi:MAG: Uma2 family endonuclease [Polyangiaceae bacterium]